MQPIKQYDESISMTETFQRMLEIFSERERWQQVVHSRNNDSWKTLCLKDDVTAVSVFGALYRVKPFNVEECKRILFICTGLKGVNRFNDSHFTNFYLVVHVIKMALATAEKIEWQANTEKFHLRYRK